MRGVLVSMLASAAAIAQVKLPPYTRDVLPNGVTVYLMRKSGLPLVDFRIVVRGGAESERAGQSGVASITAELLRRGTSKRTADQFSEQLDFLGGTFNAHADEQSTQITAEFLKKDLEAGLGLVSDALLHPAFSADEVKKLIGRRIDSVRAAKDNPQMAIGSYYRSFYFGPRHPYGRIADEGSLDRIQPDDIALYHKRFYVGKNMTVIVAGDLDPAAARSAVAGAFADAPEGARYDWAEGVKPAGGARVLLVDKPDATQTYFVIAQPGIGRTNPDRVALMLVNTLFGGRFTSLLNQALRVDSGLTYGAYSMMQQSRLPGCLCISTYTKTEATRKAIDMALDVMKRLREKGITAEQLASAKAYVKGTYPMRQLETADQLAAVLGELELYGLGREEVDQFFARIDAVTLEQANAAARKYFRADDLTFVLVGNSSKIRDAAARYAPRVIERSIMQPGWGD